MQLFEHQADTIEKARDSIRSGNKRIIIHGPTGSGKTIIAASIVSSAIEKGKRVLFLVHFRELAYQAIDKFSKFGIGNETGLIMAGEDYNLDKPIQVASIQTYINRLKLADNGDKKWFQDVDLVIYDECHASIARTRKAVLERYKDTAVILGLTATPCRADSRGLGEVYQDIVSCSNIKKLTKEKYLVPVVYYGAKEKPDLKNIPIVAGDYNKKELGKRVDKAKLVGDIYENWMRIAGDHQTVIFSVNVKHSQHIKQKFESKGVSIKHVDAHTPEEERRDILNRFESGDVQVVTNCSVYSEGADFPWASCIVLAKPSKSYARFVQMGGRGLRTYPNKEQCIIIDHARLVSDHGYLGDEVFWTLEGKEKAWRIKNPRKKEKTIMECDMCRAMFTGKRCPQCGLEVKNYGKKIETSNEELVELKGKKKKATMEEKRVFYGMLEYRRREKGYAPGWAAHKFREKFSVWPNSFKNVGPIKPDQGFINYMTHLNIKWAKSKKRAA